ncbi:hypothetical protein L4Z64_001226 [Pseudomonas aeruginosa]|nr:hypothetical protein [Pseudomonas aeruginosa]MCS8414856.1 hypothetical protein [Pseudomonas aeruginosa]MCS9764363.1 hypothetical protein [Pseudomonas aeruginosa]MCS9822403.1 hypothetical protein [Pseudomonas aeruginosa]MCT0241120.1 hypothetical protein [Pseudomonas aeruginosa]
MCAAPRFSNVISTTPLGVVSTIAAQMVIPSITLCERVEGTSWVTSERNVKAFGSAGLVVWDYRVSFADDVVLLVSACDASRAAESASAVRARLDAMSIAA